MYHSWCKKIEIAKKLPWDREMEVLIHEFLHFLQDRYKGHIRAMNDDDFVRYNETNDYAQKICRLIVQDRFKKLFKKHGRIRSKRKNRNPTD